MWTRAGWRAAGCPPHRTLVHSPPRSTIVREEVEQLIRAAIEFHIEGLLDGGFPVPEPTALVTYVDVQSQNFSPVAELQQ